MSRFEKRLKSHKRKEGKLNCFGFDSTAGADIGRPILFAGLTVGVVDGIAATAESSLRGVKPIVVFQYVASGILGTSSFTGGFLTYTIGLFLHFIVAFGVSAVYVGASRFFPTLVRAPMICGPIYGVVVYIFMREVVSPLSHVPKLPTTVSSTLILMLIHIFCVGLPIALVVHKFADHGRKTPGS